MDSADLPSTKACAAQGDEAIHAARGSSCGWRPSGRDLHTPTPLTCAFAEGYFDLNTKPQVKAMIKCPEGEWTHDPTLIHRADLQLQ